MPVKVYSTLSYINSLSWITGNVVKNTNRVIFGVWTNWMPGQSPEGVVVALSLIYWEVITIGKLQRINSYMLWHNSN